MHTSAGCGILVPAALGEATPPGELDWASSLLSQVEEAALVPARPARVASWIGPTSPRRLDDLASMKVGELVSYLRSWTPTGELAPSPESLGRALSGAIGQHSMRFSKSASAFTGLEPVYIRSVFSGLCDALKDGQRISWGPVLELAAWVVNQPLGKLRPDWVREDHDPGWDTRDEIAQFSWWCGAAVLDVR